MRHPIFAVENAVISILARLLSVAAAVALVFVSGCAEETIEFREVHRIDEPITTVDLDRLERIAEVMRDGRLPEMAPHFLPEPRWASDRPASVATLAKEEMGRLRDVIRGEDLVESLANNPRLEYALSKEQMTHEQYVGLVLSVGMAFHRARLDPARDLDRYLEVGEAQLKDLAKRDESFASLSNDGRIDALEQATWITRVNRAQRLQNVPAANVERVLAVEQSLQKILPRQFLNDPIQGLNDPLIDYGIPFREQAETGFDAEISWSRQDEQAVIGGKSVANTSEFYWLN